MARSDREVREQAERDEFDRLRREERERLRTRREVAWGWPCEREIERADGTRARCAHAQVIHRGQGHTGPCAALECAIDLGPRGWSTTSRCAGYVGPDPDGPPIPDATGEAPTTPSSPEVPW